MKKVHSDVELKRLMHRPQPHFTWSEFALSQIVRGGLIILRSITPYSAAFWATRILASALARRTFDVSNRFPALSRLLRLFGCTFSSKYIIEIIPSFPFQFLLNTRLRAVAEPLSIAFRCWCLIEILFFIWVRWFLYWRKTVFIPPSDDYSSLSRAQHLDAITKAMANGPCSQTQAMRGWFLGAKSEHIRKQNIREWLASSLFFHRDGWASLGEEQRAEIEAWMNHQQKHCAMEFSEGYTPDLPSMRVPTDTLQSSHRPLLVYASLATFNIAATTILELGGFKRDSVTVPSESSFTMKYWIWRPAGAAQRSSVPTADCHCRQRERKESGPRVLVFLHGVGLGVAPYVHFLLQLSRLRGAFAAIIAVEVEHICIRVRTRPVPSDQAVVAAIEAVLVKQGLRGWHQPMESGSPRTCGHGIVFCGHSFGTIVATWVLKRRPALFEGGALMLLDPACFLQFLPFTSFKIFYRQPIGASERIVHFSISTDPFLRLTLQRTYWWQNNLWPEEDLVLPLENRGSSASAAQLVNRTVVLLSEHDELLPVAALARYLRSHEVEFVCEPELRHAEFIFDGVVRDAMVRRAQALAACTCDKPICCCGGDANDDDEGCDK